MDRYFYDEIVLFSKTYLNYHFLREKMKLKEEIEQKSIQWGPMLKKTLSKSEVWGVRNSIGNK